MNREKIKERLYKILNSEGDIKIKNRPYDYAQPYVNSLKVIMKSEDFIDFLIENYTSLEKILDDNYYYDILNRKKYMRLIFCRPGYIPDDAEDQIYLEILDRNFWRIFIFKIDGFSPFIELAKAFNKNLKLKKV